MTYMESGQVGVLVFEFEWSIFAALLRYVYVVIILGFSQFLHLSKDLLLLEIRPWPGRLL